MSERNVEITTHVNEYGDTVLTTKMALTPRELEVIQQTDTEAFAAHLRQRLVEKLIEAWESA